MGGGRGIPRERASGLLARGLGSEAIGLLRETGSLARARGERACLVGGCVRDLLLDRAGRDLDVVVEGDGPGLARLLAGRAGGRWRSHAAFGTATVELAGGIRLDLATARRESYSRPAALPNVEPAGLRADLLRRDFTVNCLALDLSPRLFGSLIDPCGGREDLRAGRIRVLHDRSFLDDPTRIFRAVRLAARLGFRIEPRTARLVEASLERGMLDRLSAARLRREIAAALEEQEVVTVARALQRRAVWSRIDPALAVGRKELTRLGRQRRFLARDAGGAGAERPRAWVAALALLVFERSPDQRRRLVRRLRPDRRSAELLAAAPSEARALLRGLGGAGRPRPGTIWAACREFSALAVELAWIVTDSGRLRTDLERYLSEWRDVRADIDGKDLLEAGIPRGPAIARGLRAALRAKLDGRAPDRESQLARALRAAGRA